MRRFHLLFIGIVIAFGSASCAPSAPPPPTPDVKATETRIASNIFGTQTASVPTATKTQPITDTPFPTDTPRPTSTRPPEPTASPIQAEVIVTSTLETGWILYEGQTSRFALALPPSWRQLDLSQNGLDNSLAVVGELNPKYHGVLSSQALRSLLISGVRLYALDSSPEALALSFPTTMNVLQVDIGVALPLDSVASLTLQQVKKTADPLVPVTDRRVQLSNIEAEELKYGTSLALGTGQSILLIVTQYLVVDGTTESIVTFVGPSELADKSSPIFEEIGQSFRLLK